jgi:hypothetical protein
MVRRVFRYQFARQSFYSKFSFWTKISNTNAQSGATRKGNVCRDDRLYIYAYTNEALFSLFQALQPRTALVCVRTPRSNNSQYRQSFKATAIHSWRPVNNNEEVDLAIYTWADTLPKRRLLSPITHGSWLVDNGEGGRRNSKWKKGARGTGNDASHFAGALRCYTQSSLLYTDCNILLRCHMLCAGGSSTGLQWR